MAGNQREYSFDDDDYQPRASAREPGSRGGIPRGVLVGVGLAALVTVGLIAFVAMRAQRGAARFAEHAAVERNAAIAERMQAGASAPWGGGGMRGGPDEPGAVESNWSKVLGEWQREPAETGDTKSPYEFDFRPNGTAKTTRRRSEGGVRLDTYQVETYSHVDDEFTLRLRGQEGVIAYRFRLDPDGTLVLKDGDTEVVFNRAKTPE
jgi:hypothetical protein